ncbi:HEAT repeat domain-containing protein, partial [Elusimicrobiota bacterium]
LARLGGEEAVPLIIRALRGPDSEIRAQAAAALGRFCTPKAVDVLIKELGNEYAGIRLEAAKSLGRCGDERAAPVLAGVLGDHDTSVRLAALWALRQSGPLKKEHRPRVLRLLREDKEVEVRRSAALSIKRSPSPEAGPALVAALKDEDRSVRRLAIEAFGRLGSLDDAAVPDVAKLLLSPDEPSWTRAELAKLLGTSGSERAVDPLVRASGDEDRFVRSAAALALARLGPVAKDAVPAMERVCRVEKEGRFLKGLPEALEKMGTPDAKRAARTCARK